MIHLAHKNHCTSALPVNLYHVGRRVYISISKTNSGDKLAPSAYSLTPQKLLFVVTQTRSWATPSPPTLTQRHSSNGIAGDGNYVNHKFYYQPWWLLISPVTSSWWLLWSAADECWFWAGWLGEWVVMLTPPQKQWLPGRLRWPVMRWRQWMVAHNSSHKFIRKLPANIFTWGCDQVQTIIPRARP